MPRLRVLPAHVRRRVALPLAAAATGALVLAGCGGDDEPTASTGAAPVPGGGITSALADDVPAGAVAFAEATIRPGGDVKAAIEDIASVAGVTDVGAAIVKGLDIDDDDLGGASFERDVLPALGDHVGGFAVRDGGARQGRAQAAGAFVAEVRDAAALRKALDEELRRGTQEQAEGQTYYRGPGDSKDVAVWIGDQTFAVGQVPAVRAAIAAAKGPDLAGAERFEKAVSQVRADAEDVAGVGYVDLQQADVLNGLIERATGSSRGRQAKLRSRLRQLERGSSSLPDIDRLSRGFTIPKIDATQALAVELAPGRLRVHSAGTGPAATGTSAAAADALAALPAGSWLAASLDGIQETLKLSGQYGGQDPKELLELLRSQAGVDLPQDLVDAVSGLRSATVSVRGDSLTSLGGAVTLQAKDAAAATTLLERLRKLAESETPLRFQEQTVPGADKGLVTQLPGLPFQIAAGIKGDRLAIGLGTEAVGQTLSPSSKLGDDPIHASAEELLGGQEPSFLLDASRISNLLGTLPLGSLDDPDAKKVLDVVRRLKLAAVGGSSSGTTWTSTLGLSWTPPLGGTSGGSGTTTGSSTPGR